LLARVLLDLAAFSFRLLSQRLEKFDAAVMRLVHRLGGRPLPEFCLIYMHSLLDFLTRSFQSQSFLARVLFDLAAFSLGFCRNAWRDLTQRLSVWFIVLVAVPCQSSV
jgi:hypothetical protein